MRILRLALVFALIEIVSPSLAQDPARERLEREANAQAERADALFKTGQFEAALKLYEAERVSRKTLGDARYEALALRGIGCCLTELSLFEPAIEALTSARDLDSRREDKGFEGFDNLLIGKARLRSGDPLEAIKAVEAALPKLAQSIDRDHSCDAHIVLLTAKLRLGQPSKATSDADKAIELAEAIHDEKRLADAWLGDGLVAHGLGDYSLAFERIQDAASLYRAQDRKPDLGVATRHLADISQRLGRSNRAIRRFYEAIDLFRTLNDRGSEADTRLDLAALLLDHANAPDSLIEATKARDLYAEINDESGEIEALVILAQTHPRSKEGTSKSVELITTALDLSANLHRDQPAERVRLLLLAASLERRLDNVDRVKALLAEAEKLTADKLIEQSLKNAVNQAKTRLIK
jgi:tetratricopeptide (TPR) repeat protein